MLKPDTPATCQYLTAVTGYRWTLAALDIFGIPCMQFTVAPSSTRTSCNHAGPRGSSFAGVCWLVCSPLLDCSCTQRFCWFKEVMHVWESVCKKKLRYTLLYRLKASNAHVENVEEKGMLLYCSVEYLTKISGRCNSYILYQVTTKYRLIHP